MWKQLGLPKPTRAQLEIAKYLQRGPKRLQISAFRGVGKSWITAAFVLWILYKDPDKKIMVVSASKERADNFAIFTQKCILDISFLNHLGPKSDDQRWRAEVVGACQRVHAAFKVTIAAQYCRST